MCRLLWLCVCRVVDRVAACLCVMCSCVDVLLPVGVDRFLGEPLLALVVCLCSCTDAANEEFGMCISKAAVAALWFVCSLSICYRRGG